MKQRTIKSNVTIKGVGLHTGRRCQITFLPAPENSGIKFVRTDLPGQPVLPALVDFVVDVIRGTTLGVGEARVYTIEHVLSALAGTGIDNVTIEMDENEPPVGDGSARPFTDALAAAGIVEQEGEKLFFTVDAPFEYSSNQTVIRIEPSDSFEIQCEIDYDHPMIKKQMFKFDFSKSYEAEVAPARTFCFDYEIEILKKSGLAKGGSLDNAIVIGPSGIYNPGESLRFENEFVRHKMLDLIGDLTLIGRPLQAKVVAQRCGHGHNVKFLKELLQQRAETPPVSVG